MAPLASQVSATDFPGHYPGESNHWDLDHFKRGLRVQLNSLSPSALEFDLVGVDASVANALRRIVIAEVRTQSRTLSPFPPTTNRCLSPKVPTVAVENVYVWNNTSIIQDEVLAQRLGLIPLAIDPRKLEPKKSACFLCFLSALLLASIGIDGNILDAGADEPPTDLNTVVFSLVARCERLRDVKKGETDPHKIWSGVEGSSLFTSARPTTLSPISESAVLSSHMEFSARGGQLELFGDRLPKPANDNILIAKMRGGQVRRTLLLIVRGHC